MNFSYNQIISSIENNLQDITIYFIVEFISVILISLRFTEYLNLLFLKYICTFQQKKKIYQDFKRVHSIYVNQFKHNIKPIELTTTYLLYLKLIESFVSKILLTKSLFIETKKVTTEKQYYVKGYYQEEQKEAEE